MNRSIPNVVISDLPGIEGRSEARLLTNSVRLAVAHVLQHLLGYIRGLVLPNLLGPIGYGMVAAIALVERYSTFVNLGIHTATLYQVPAKHAAGHWEEAKAINDTVFSFSVLMGCLAGVALLSWTWLFRQRFSSELATGLLIAGATPLFISVRGVFMTWLRAYQAFGVMSYGGILGALALLVLSVGLGWLWNVPGVVTGQVLALLLMLAYLYFRSGMRFGFSLKPGLLLSLLRFSIPMHFVLGGLGVYLSTADRLAVVQVLGIEQAGYYAIGQTLVGVLALIPAATSIVLSTSVIAEAGRPSGAARKYLVTGTLATATAVAALMACLIPAAPAVFELLFPAYHAGTEAAKWLAVVMYFESPGVVAHYVVVIRGRLGAYIGYYALLSAIAYWGLGWAGSRGGIVAVAIGMVLLTAARTLWLFYLASRLTGSSAEESWSLLGVLVAIGAVAASIGWVVDWMVPWPEYASRWAIVGVTVVRVTIAGGCVLLAGLLAGRQFGVSPRAWAGAVLNGWKAGSGAKPFL